METNSAASSSSQTLTFAGCFSSAAASVGEADENAFQPPPKFPVFCGSCWVPIRDLVSLKKHRAQKRHYCREYPTSYQKPPGFVKKDFRKSWRKERTKFNPRTTATAAAAPSPIVSTSNTATFRLANVAVPNFVFTATITPTTTTTTSPPIAKLAKRTIPAVTIPAISTTPSNFRFAVANTTNEPETDEVFNLEELFSSAEAKSVERNDFAFNGHVISNGIDATAEKKSSFVTNEFGGAIFPVRQSIDKSAGLNAVAIPSASTSGAVATTTNSGIVPSPFQPLQSVAGNLGGYFTYSKQNGFIKSQPPPTTVSSQLPGIVPLSPKKTTASFTGAIHNAVSHAQTSSIPPVENSATRATSRAPAKLNEDFLGRLKTFREERFLTDIFIVVEERKVFAHKIVLSAQSPFFKDLIGKCANNTPNYGLRLDFGFTYDAFAVALDYMYGFLNEEKILPFNAAEVRAVAQKLELEGLVKYSEDVGLGRMTAAPAEVAEPAPAVEAASRASPFRVDDALAELSNICAEFTATALDSDDSAQPLASNMDAPMEEAEREDPPARRRKPDPPLSSVDAGVHFESPVFALRRPEGVVRRDSQTLMTPNSHLGGNGVEAEILDGSSFKNDYFPAGLDENPFDDLFNFGDGHAIGPVFGSPVFGGAFGNNNNHNNNNNNNNNNNSLVSNNNVKHNFGNDGTYDNDVNAMDSFFGTQQKMILSPPAVVHPPRTMSQSTPTTLKKRELSASKEAPATLLLSSPLKRPLSYKSQPATTPSSSKTFMNCIICQDVIEGPTKIEQWIKLCQHLAVKHKKVIDREILSKQFGIKDSAITSSVLEGSGDGAGASGFVGNLVAADVFDTVDNASNSASAIVTDERRGDAKTRLNRFLCQKRILNAELMIHVRKVPSLEGKDDRYGCLRCGKEFDSLTPVQRHLVVNHNVPLPGLQILMCSHCGNKDVDREENMSERGPSKSCNVCKHRMSRFLD